MVRRSAVITICTLSSALLAGCAGDTSPPPTLAPLAGGERSSLTLPADDPTVVELGDGSRMQLVDPGAEPREPLRLEPTAGTVQEHRGAIRLSMTVTADGDRETIPTPSFTIDERITVESVADDRITSRHELVDLQWTAGGTPRALPPIPGADPTEGGGAVYRSVLTDTAVLVGDTVTLRDLAVAQGAEESAVGIRESTMPLPTDAVGVGATWRIAEELDIDAGDGLAARAITELRITSIDDDRIVASMEGRMSFRPKAYATLGAMYEVTGGEVYLTGTVTWLRGGTVPLLDYTATGGVRMRASGGGRRANVSFDIEVDVDTELTTLTPAPRPDQA